MARKLLIPWVAILLVTAFFVATLSLVLAWIYPARYWPQLGVNGVTIQLHRDVWINYSFHVNQGEKVVITLTNFVGSAGICVLHDYVWSCKWGAAPLTHEYNYSRTQTGFIVMKALDTSTTASLTWDKQTCGSSGCSSTNEGKYRAKPMPVTDYGKSYGIEASFGSESYHYYSYTPDQNPVWGSSFSFIASIVGSIGTDFDLYVYDNNDDLVGKATDVSYPDYVYIDASSTQPYLIEVYAYSKSSINEYHLQVSRPQIQGYNLSKTTFKPGETFTINYRILNPFPHSIDVVLGASIAVYDDHYGKWRIYNSSEYDVTVTLSPGEGTYSRSFTVPKDAYCPGGTGSYKLMLGLWGYKSSSGSLSILFDYKEYDKALTVTTPGTVITYTAASPSTLAPGETTTVTVKWVFYNICPAGCKVYANAFGDWAKTQELAKIYGGVDGNYGVEQSKTFTVQLPSSITLGTHYIRVGFCYAYDYAKSYDELAGCAYKDIPITVQKISTYMLISPKSFTINSGGQKTFSAQLLDSSGKPLANKQVTWSSNIGSCNPSTTYTDSGGYAYTTCTAPVVTSQTQMTITAAFGGDYQYTQSSATATGTVNPSTYTVTVDPNGGRIYVDGSSVTSSTSYSWSYGSTHTLDPDSGYSSSPGVRKIFTQWSDGSRDDPRTTTVTGSATYVANWLTQYQLTITMSPSGAGSTSPAGSNWYDEGASVTVTATPASGYVFDHWELDGASAGTSPSITVSMTKPHTLVAVFTQKNTPSYSLVLVVRGGDNRVYYNLFNGTWLGWKALPSGSTLDSPAAAFVGGDLHVVVRGGDNKSLWHAVVDPLTNTFKKGWTRLNGSTPSRPVLTTDGTNLYLVVQGCNNRIYYNLFNGTWLGWKALPSGSTIDAPAAAFLNGKLHIVVRGTDGKSIWYTQVDPSTGATSVWTTLSGSTPSAPYLTTDGSKLYLLVRGSNNVVYCNIYSGGNWGVGWKSPSTGSTSATPAGAVAGTSLYVVVLGRDGRSLYYTTMDLNTQTFASLWKQIIPGSTPSPPTLVPRR